MHGSVNLTMWLILQLNRHFGFTLKINRIELSDRLKSTRIGPVLVGLNLGSSL